MVQFEDFIQHSSNSQESRAFIHASTQFRMVKSGPAWFSPPFKTKEEGCISECESLNEMG